MFAHGRALLYASVSARAICDCLQGRRNSGHKVGTATLDPLNRLILGAPYGIRTRVTALRGRCPRPLDEGSSLNERRGKARYYRGAARLLKRDGTFIASGSGIEGS